MGRRIKTSLNTETEQLSSISSTQPTSMKYQFREHIMTQSREFASNYASKLLQKNNPTPGVEKTFSFRDIEIDAVDTSRPNTD